MICITNIVNNVEAEIAKNTNLLVSDWMSIIAILLSILSLVLTFYFNKKERKNYLAEKTFENIFFEELPKSLNCFYEKRNEDSFNELINVIKILLDKLLFYKYYKKNMYKKTKELIVQLEEICTKYMDRADPQIWGELEKNLAKIVDQIYK